MINKLIEKYKGKIDHNNKLQKQLNTVGSYATDLYNDNEVCEEILQDLEELKENLTNGEGMEKLSDIEHKRWGKWQKYLHSLCIKNDDGSLIIPKERVKHWEWEIETDYKDLPENIKEYDSAEVRNTLKAIIGE